MKPKKIIMIILLILFIAAIVFTLININQTSQEKISPTSTNTEKKTTKNVTSAGTVRNTIVEAEKTSNKTIEITDNFFIEQTTDLYLNMGDYIGKTIKIEGLIYQYPDENGDICYAVVRNTPGCCGNDGLAGVDIRYDGEYPAVDTWVSIEGVLGKDFVYGEYIPALQVTAMKETKEGKTFVTN